MSKKTIVLRASRLEMDGPVATFSHQSPATRNAMSPDLQRDYVELFQQVRGDRGLRALIITGSQAAARFSEGKPAQYDWDRDIEATSQAISQ